MDFLYCRSFKEYCCENYHMILIANHEDFHNFDPTMLHMPLQVNYLTVESYHLSRDPGEIFASRPKFCL